MNQARTQANILALLSIIATFTIAYGLDRWVERSRTDAAQTFNFGSVFWIITLANVVLAGCFVTIVWLMRNRGTQPLISILCVVLGLGMTLLPAAGFARIFSLPFSIISVLSPTSRVGLTSAFITVLGVYSLVAGNRAT